MLNIFKKREDRNGAHPERAAKREAIDSTLDYAKEQADDITRMLKRKRVKQMLRGALESDSG